MASFSPSDLLRSKVKFGSLYGPRIGRGGVVLKTLSKPPKQFNHPDRDYDRDIQVKSMGGAKACKAHSEKEPIHDTSHETGKEIYRRCN